MIPAVCVSPAFHPWLLMFPSVSSVPSVALCFQAAFRRRVQPSSPIMPMPKRTKVDGSGTAAL